MLAKLFYDKAFCFCLHPQCLTSSFFEEIPRAYYIIRYEKEGFPLPSLPFFSIFIAHSESPLPRQVTCDINNYVQGRIRQRMEEQEISKLLDISRACEMKTFITSILTSKPVCQLSKDEIDHLSIVILKVCLFIH